MQSSCKSCSTDHEKCTDPTKTTDLAKTPDMFDFDVKHDLFD